jgi:hypothetical protein
VSNRLLVRAERRFMLVHARFNTPVVARCPTADSSSTTLIKQQNGMKQLRVGAFGNSHCLSRENVSTMIHGHELNSQRVMC